MPSKPKKRVFLSRISSLFKERPSLIEDLDEWVEIEEGTGPSHSPSSLLPADTSTTACSPTFISQPPIQRSRNNVRVPVTLQTVNSVNGRRGEGLIQPRHPYPALHLSLPSSEAFDPQSQGHSHNPGPSQRPGRGATSFFTGASGFRMGDLHYIEAPSASHITLNAGGCQNESLDGWKLLLNNTAPNALHNSHARYDPPKCDEDTRVEVTSEIMGWIEDRSGPQRLLCMTGAAGAGKSALQQTIAEKCGRKNILAATFFCSAADPTRNSVQTIVPTIAYQLGRTSLPLKQLINAAVEDDPLIFSQSLQAQITTLIVGPVRRLQRESRQVISGLPHAILIDGLDECKEEDRQAELLTAIRECLLEDGLPFRIFVASRPEWAIRTALEPGGHLRATAYHIQLSDKYDAKADIRRYLVRRLQDIGRRNGLSSHWFTPPDVEELVSTASGQFIYAATVIKWISERRAGSPAERLKILLTWNSYENQNAKPFEKLDMLYTNILLAAKEAYEAVDTHGGRDFILLLRIYHINGTTRSWGPRISRFDVPILTEILSLETNAERSLFSDLHSLVAIHPRSGCLNLYHKSFADFLSRKSRSKDLYVSDSQALTHIVKCCLERIIQCSLEPYSVSQRRSELPLSHQAVMEAVLTLPPLVDRAVDIGEALVDFTQKSGWQKIDQLIPLVRKLCPNPLCASNLIYYQFICDEVIDAVEPMNPDPEVVAVMRHFDTKWNEEAEKRRRQRMATSGGREGHSARKPHRVEGPTEGRGTKSRMNSGTREETGGRCEASTARQGLGRSQGRVVLDRILYELVAAETKAMEEALRVSRR